MERCEKNGGKEHVVERTATGQRRCKLCGKLLGLNIDNGAEQRLFGDENDSSKKRSQEGAVGEGLKIRAGGNGKGRVYVDQEKDPKQREQEKNMAKLTELCNTLNYTGILVKSAKGIYENYLKIVTESKQKAAEEAKLGPPPLKREKRKTSKIRGDSSNEFFCAVIFCACKKCGHSVTMEYLSKGLGVKHSKVHDYYKKLTQIVPVIPSAINISGLIPSYCTKLNIKNDLIICNMQKFCDALMSSLEGCKPQTVVGVAIYMYLKNLDSIKFPCVLDKIAKEVGMNAETISKRSQSIDENILNDLKKIIADFCSEHKDLV